MKIKYLARSEQMVIYKPPNPLCLTVIVLKEAQGEIEGKWENRAHKTHVSRDTAVHSLN